MGYYYCVHTKFFRFAQSSILYYYIRKTIVVFRILFVDDDKMVIVGWKVIVFRQHMTMWWGGAWVHVIPRPKASLLNFTRSANIQNFKRLYTWIDCILKNKTRIFPPHVNPNTTCHFPQKLYLKFFKILGRHYLYINSFIFLFR